MNGKDDVLDLRDLSKRRDPAFFIAKSIALLAHRLLVKPHVELDNDIVRLRRQEGVVFFYAALHKSLWETSGALVPLHLAGLPIPYIGMGDNLIHGRFFRGLSERIGIFLIKRPGSRKEMIESARKLHRDILGYVAHGVDVLVFPEGTRRNIPDRESYGSFFPTAFDPLLEYERNKQRLCAENPGLRPRDVYVIPVNVDYSFVRETYDMLRNKALTPQTLHVFDSLSMVRNIGDTYLSYGKPMRVAERLDLDRKRLAMECRNRCMELVKILPVNVVSLAMLRLDPGAPFSKPLLGEAVDRCVEELRPYTDRFRGFSPDDSPDEIIRRAKHNPLQFDRLLAEDAPVYRMYAGYVRHYLPPETESA